MKKLLLSLLVLCTWLMTTTAETLSLEALTRGQYAARTITCVRPLADG